MEEYHPASPQRSSQALPEGTCFRGLSIEAVLGICRFSNTYLARGIETGDLVVLKEHFPEALCYREADSPAVIARETPDTGAALFAWSVENFTNEAKSLCSLEHPGVVEILGGFRSFGTAYYVMPFIEGGSLEEQIRLRHAHGPEFSAEELHGLLWRMLEGLDAIHRHGICHEGIRPENILLNEAGVPAVIGFSGARRRLCERMSLQTEKSAYTPIEQRNANGTIGPQSDVFALGATLFTIITGNPPAVATPIPLTRRLGLLERYPEALLASVDRALKPGPGDRFRDAAEWRIAIWGDFTEEESTTEDSVTPVSPPSPEEQLREEREKAEREKAEREKAEREKAEREKAEREKAERERAERERAERERAEREKAEREKAEREKAEREKAERERTEREKAVSASDPSPVVPPLPQKRFTGRHLAGALVLIAVLAAISVFLLQQEPPPTPPLSVSTAGSRPIMPSAATAIPDPLVEPDPLPPRAPVATLNPSGAPATSPEAISPVEAVPMAMEGSEAGQSRVFGGIEMIWCPPGTFAMGSPWNEKGRFMDETPHEVILTRGFWIARTETTQKQWEVITTENPSWRKGENLPVEKVAWDDVRRWLEKKNTQDPLPAGWKWSLPTEAQWEYACRAGSTTPIYSGPMEILGALNAPALDQIAWYGGNSSVGYTGPGMDTAEWKEKQYPGGLAGEREVGGKIPNAWGLHDMIGNVWEWCADWMGPYEIGTVIDPTGPVSGEDRVMRGGSWANGPDLCRSAARNGNPGDGGDGLGFRSVIVPAETPGH